MNFSDEEKQILGRPEFQEAIEKLNTLIQQNKRVFLIGAGCSKCADLPLMVELTEKIIDECKVSATGKILEHIRKFSSNKGTIEDYLSELIDYLAIGERRQGFCDDPSVIKIKIGDEDYDCKAIRECIEEIKQKIKVHLDKVINIEVHRNFVQQVHNVIRPGKKTLRENVDYLILNYDTLFEDALAIENIEFVDGFKGGASAYWDSTTFENQQAYAKIIKVHGSIDWLIFNNETFPRRINSKVKLDSFEAHSILIYPASTKYIETSIDPFSKLFEIARLSLKTDKEQQKVLVSIGYSFSDLHINKEIENAIIRSDGHLTLIIFIKDENNSVISRWRKSDIFKNNVIIYSGNGVFHGDKEVAGIADGESLEWWKFEKLTNLLRGEL